eukprot:GHVR01168163.1.p1 GENE.GHVR01168163.1~~GHVR01168163.1.p1  ORF type:complete len:143 (-),score=5.36 GHVR01168163.1:141-569(-)
MHKKILNRRFCVAPMLDWSDRQCRVFWRQLTTEAVLYTEMITTGALIHGDAERHLNFSDIEHPVALQLGGSDPDALVHSVRLAEKWGYDEVNLNCGCPSDRVQNGFFWRLFNVSSRTRRRLRQGYERRDIVTHYSKAPYRYR